MRRYAFILLEGGWEEDSPDLLYWLVEFQEAFTDYGQAIWVKFHLKKISSPIKANQLKENFAQMSSIACVDFTEQ